MDPIMLTLRWIHVVAGCLWAGAAVFIAFVLQPAIDDAGPAAGALMPALRRRGLMTVLPLLALATILSGMGLFWLVGGGDLQGFLHSGTGLALALGGMAALLAFLVGILVMRPSMMGAATIMQSLASAPAEEQAGRLAAATELRIRGGRAARYVGILLLLA
ncbi:MAG: hypothetical protein ACHQ2E_09845, partial [Gemmatimonadales bacterium]